MRVWAVANQKGGVGKTTTVVSLAGLLSAQGHKSLIIDMDPHGSLSTYFGLDPDTVKQSIYQIFKAKKNLLALSIASLITRTQFNNLCLLPASTALATLDRQLGSIDGMGLVVRNSLVNIRSRFEFVIIDCPPQLGVLMINALAACDHLIIPVQTEFLALKGLERMTHTLTMINKVKGINNCLPFTILPTMFDCRTRASVDTLKELNTRYKENCWRSVIPVDTQFREASKAGSPLPIRSPNDRGSLAYKEFLEYLINPEAQKIVEVS